MSEHKLFKEHKCCPKEWRAVKDMTGSYELDGMIARTSNRDMHAKLEDFLVSDEAYALRTDYNGYNGMD